MGTTTKKLSPFDYLKSINDTKVDLMVDEESTKWQMFSILCRLLLI